MSAADYQIVDIPLDSVTPGKVPVSQFQSGTQYTGVYYQPVVAGGVSIPAGADVLLHFGNREGVLVSSVFQGFAFECPVDEGIYYTNRVALAAGTVLRLLVTQGNGPNAGS